MTRRGLRPGKHGVAKPYSNTCFWQVLACSLASRCMSLPRFSQRRCIHVRISSVCCRHFDVTVFFSNSNFDLYQTSFIFVVFDIVAQVASTFVVISKQIGIRNSCRKKNRFPFFYIHFSFMGVVTRSHVGQSLFLRNICSGLRLTRQDVLSRKAPDEAKN